MKSIIDIFNSIETKQENSIGRSNKRTFYTLLNYLQASHKGISKFDMEHFLSGNRFSNVFQELLANSIVTESKNNYYVLRKDIKDSITPFLSEFAQQVYNTNYNSKITKQKSEKEVYSS